MLWYYHTPSTFESTFFKILNGFFLFLKENGWYPFQYGIPPRQRTHKGKKIPEAVRRTLMKLLDIESKPGNWRYLAERLGASYTDVQFLESRNHESPTQHVLNVFETMNKPLTFLRDIFIDLDRHDVVTVLNDEINRSQIGHGSGQLFKEWDHAHPAPQRNRAWIRSGCKRHRTVLT